MVAGVAPARCVTWIWSSVLPKVSSTLWIAWNPITFAAAVVNVFAPMVVVVPAAGDESVFAPPPPLTDATEPRPTSSKRSSEEPPTRFSMLAKRSRPSVPAPGALIVHVIGVPSA